LDLPSLPSSLPPSLPSSFPPSLSVNLDDEEDVMSVEDKEDLPRADPPEEPGVRD
jgi:hypothetical protein